MYFLKNNVVGGTTILVPIFKRKYYKILKQNCVLGVC